MKTAAIEPKALEAAKKIFDVLSGLPADRAIAVLGAVAMLNEEYAVAQRCLDELRERPWEPETRVARPKTEKP